MKALLTAVALAAVAFTTSAAHADEEENARNHGYETAALETVCSGILEVGNQSLRTKLDKMYRNSSRWRETFLEGYAAVANKGRRDSPLTLYITCTNAGDAKWLRVVPAAYDQLTIRMREAKSERRK